MIEEIRLQKLKMISGETQDLEGKQQPYSIRRPLKPYLRITLAYFLFGLLWIVFSDFIISQLSLAPDATNLLHVCKGWFFVSFSSILIFSLSRRSFLDHVAEEKSKQEVFQKTVEGSHHILLNYLNQMQLFMLKAEECSDFDKADIELAQSLSEKAAAELMKLRDIDTITPERIHSVIYEEIQKKK